MATGGQPPDLVLPVKVESSNTLGNDADAGDFSPHTPLQDWEDGISVGGLYLQVIDDGGSPVRDKLAGIYRDADGNIKAFDPQHTEVNLLDAAAGADGKDVKVSADDSTPGYLESKIVGGPGIDTETLNPAANEQLQLSTGYRRSFLLMGA